MAHPSSYLSRIQYGEKTTARAAALALQDLEAAGHAISPPMRNLPAPRTTLCAAQITVERGCRYARALGANATGHPVALPQDNQPRRRLHHRYSARMQDRRRFGLVTSQGSGCWPSTRSTTSSASVSRGDSHAKEREQAAALEKRKADIELAAILLRYSPPIESTWSDVLESLRGRHQRPDLAVAMAQTRSDWSEGPTGCATP